MVCLNYFEVKIVKYIYSYNSGLIVVKVSGFVGIILIKDYSKKKMFFKYLNFI